MIDDMYNYPELPRLMAEEIITVQPMILPVAKDFTLYYNFPEFFKKEEFEIT
jgi:hypothetical protein